MSDIETWVEEQSTSLRKTLYRQGFSKSEANDIAATVDTLLREAIAKANEQRLVAAWPSEQEALREYPECFGDDNTEETWLGCYRWLRANTKLESVDAVERRVREEKRKYVVPGTAKDQLPMPKGMGMTEAIWNEAVDAYSAMEDGIGDDELPDAQNRWTYVFAYACALLSRDARIKALEAECEAARDLREAWRWGNPMLHPANAYDAARAARLKLEGAE